MKAQTYVIKRVGDHYEARPRYAATPGHSEGNAWALGGACALFYGLTRGGLIGKAVALAGLYGFYHAFMISEGSCCQDLFRQRSAEDTGPSYNNEPEEQSARSERRQTPADEVDEASMESFPASDAPASTTSVGAE